jgi:mannose/cellobiose epimerase-like protein (N-acyl-D-glucosamine 2-epimerase family)/anti-anti-sigma regulatory factor
MDKSHFTFSDLIAGTVVSYAADEDTFGLRTIDGRQFDVKLTASTFAELVRNLGDPYIDATSQMRDMLDRGRTLFAYGIFYPEAGDMRFEAKHIVFVGRTAADFSFERPDWWVKQVKELGNFYLRAEWGDGDIDYAEYRTSIALEGRKLDGFRQETDTISRLVYGFATAYLLTGEDRFLEAAERGTEYLRDHMRTVDAGEGIAYWVHAIDVAGKKEKKILASEFGDDYDAIPAYEQIYALAGPTQTYRVTGDPRIMADIEMTHALFNRFFLDRDGGGFYSHIDPITFNPKSETLGHNQGRKNWNSVGDHAPAFLINTWLATGDEKYADFLVFTADTIVKRFTDYDKSPFVNERFHEDWSPDHAWGWQQNRAVVGHNLKIAWNLMRINSVRPNEKYVELARKIAELMPPIGSDQQRGGWYDVMERERTDDQEWHRFVWHDRKAWWQQEQAILAYLILRGVLGGEEYLTQARMASAFYNAWFLDHDNGGVYFNVLANGLPYLLGTERLKGSHSMSGYHAFELCYLAAVYTNLLITKQPLDLHFKPRADAFSDRVLHVSPDILPPGSIRIEDVWIDGQPWTDFDAEKLTVKLPEGDQVAVRVRVVSALETFESEVNVENGTASVVLSGVLDESVVSGLERNLQEALSANPRRVLLRAEQLTSLTSAGARALLFLRQKLPFEDVEVYLVGANEGVQEACRAVDTEEQSFVIVDDVSQLEPLQA